MWITLKSKIDARTIALVVQEAASYAELKEQRHFVSAGKKFFYSDPTSPNRLPLLKAIHRDIESEVPFHSLFQVPVIDHAYLLFKSPGAPATVIHQDRPYWLEKERSPSLFTAWASLGSINEDNGALTFNVENKVGPASIHGFNKNGVLYEHVDYNYGGDNAALAVCPSEAARLSSRMVPIPTEAGQVIVFDGFEPHGSTDNNTESSRLALKIVYGEGANRSGYLLKVRDLPEAIV